MLKLGQTMNLFETKKAISTVKLDFPNTQIYAQIQ